MKCPFYKICFGLFSCLFFSFFFSFSNSYALNDVSVTFHNGDSVAQWSDVFPTCTGDCLNDYSYLIINGAFDSSDWGYSTFRFYLRFNGSNQVQFNIPVAPSFSIFKLPFDGHSNNFLSFGQSYTFSSDVTFILTENYQSGIIPSGSLSITENGTYDVTNYAEAVVDIPQSSGSGGDYHNDLAAINNSILICAATCLVIYFFYCIYRMIIKGSGVK